MDHLRSALLAAASEAATLSLRYYETNLFHLKDDATLVTEGDRAVEAFLRERLESILPGAAFIGEETSGEPGGVEKAKNSEWVWVVDPIDGTTVFVDGVGTYTICIGLLREGRPFAGAMAVPAQRRIATAIRGEGALYQDEPIRVLDAWPPRKRATLYVGSMSHREIRVRFRGKTRSLGSTALHYLLVARGVAMGALSAGHVWDYAAAAAILEEAGGCLRGLDGQPIDWPSLYDGRKVASPILGASPSLWEEIAAAIEPIAPDPRRG